ncbi:hypothetical protein [Alcanivorax sp. 1008]|uniref:hypothetical protein n=1 Tax=Alcanivorax sp. 1008 TaxID=2816853 RepID=UPI001D84EEC2|nr:hypothetical protein [Alcanivorax sp. 1008]MCC1497662.1 hypothetical protein [Alcanivorax sp. 1008]
MLLVTRSLATRLIVPASLLVLLVAALKLIGYVAVIASDTGVALLLLLLWIPLAVLMMWRARRRRAVILAGCLAESSAWGHRLRGGIVMAVVQAAVALPVAIVLLAVISQPQSAGFWVLLLVSGPLWWLLMLLWQSLLAAQLSSRFLHYAAALVSLRFAGALLVSLWLLQSLWTPVLDVSELTLFQAARLGMTEAVAESQLLLLVAGIWHGFSYLYLWLVQTLTAGAPSSLLALLAWLLLLLQGACFVWPLLMWMQGVGLMFGRLLSSTVVGQGDQRPAQTASPVLPWLALMLAALLSWSILVPQPWSWLTGQSQVIQLGGSYYVLPEDRLEQILRDNADWLDEDMAGRLVALQTLADEQLDSLFSEARAQVPAYANWHYSLSGGMTRSLVAMMDYFTEDNERAVSMLSERLFPPRLWQQKLTRFEDSMAEEHRRQVALLYDDMLADLQRRLSGWEAHPHFPRDQLELIDLDVLSDSLRGAPLQQNQALGQAGVSVVAGAGAAAFSLSQSLRSVAQSRAAAQGAARAGARVASRSSATGGAVLCAASGPMALGCAVVVFTGVTLASEYAILKADEFFSRQQLEADLLVSIDALQQALSDAYQQQLLAALRQDSEELHGRLLGKFQPVQRFRAVD